jgi:hypothetical protein
MKDEVKPRQLATVGEGKRSAKTRLKKISSEF